MPPIPMSPIRPISGGAQYAKYPEHGQRFTGEPAYFKHITEAGQALMEATGTTAAGLQLCRLPPAEHQIPAAGGWRCWVSPTNRSSPGCWFPVIGNTYAGAAIIGLTAILDIAKPGDRILMVSFGSGAGSDAFSITRDRCHARSAADLAPQTQDYIARRTEIDYATYARYRGKLADEIRQEQTMTDVVIAGIGQTPVGEHWELSLRELALWPC